MKTRECADQVFDLEKAFQFSNGATYCAT